LTLVVTACGVLAAWRQTRAGADVASIVALAITGLVVSPISWTHHWVWVVPGLLLLAACGRWTSMWAVGVVFFVAPMWFVAGGGPQDPPLAVGLALLASTYFWAALAAIGYLLVAPPLVVNFVLPGGQAAVAVAAKSAETEESRHRERSAPG
jgi:alpha-1,2-mannosyltransferase